MITLLERIFIKQGKDERRLTESSAEPWELP